jgi:hypothetical protein
MSAWLDYDTVNFVHQCWMLGWLAVGAAVMVAGPEMSERHGW